MRVFCFGKAICQLNVYRGNPGDRCYFHQKSNDERMKENDDQEEPSQDFCFCGGSKKSDNITNKNLVLR